MVVIPRSCSLFAYSCRMEIGLWESTNSNHLLIADAEVNLNIELDSPWRWLEHYTGASSMKALDVEMEYHRRRTITIIFTGIFGMPNVRVVGFRFGLTVSMMYSIVDLIKDDNDSTQLLFASLWAEQSLSIRWQTLCASWQECEVYPDMSNEEANGLCRQKHIPMLPLWPDEMQSIPFMPKLAYGEQQALTLTTAKLIILISNETCFILCMPFGVKMLMHLPNQDIRTIGGTSAAVLWSYRKSGFPKDIILLGYGLYILLIELPTVKW